MNNNSNAKELHVPMPELQLLEPTKAANKWHLRFQDGSTFAMEFSVIESEGLTKEEIIAVMSAAPLLMNNFTEALGLLIDYIEFMDIKPTNDVDSAKRFIKSLESVHERTKALTNRNKNN